MGAPGRVRSSANSVCGNGVRTSSRLASGKRELAWEPGAPVRKLHASFSWPTLAGVISVRVLYPFSVVSCAETSCAGDRAGQIRTMPRQMRNALFGRIRRRDLNPFECTTQLRNWQNDNHRDMMRLCALGIHFPIMGPALSHLCKYDGYS